MNFMPQNYLGQQWFKQVFKQVIIGSLPVSILLSKYPPD